MKNIKEENHPLLLEGFALGPLLFGFGVAERDGGAAEGGTLALERDPDWDLVRRPEGGGAESSVTGSSGARGCNLL